MLGNSGLLTTSSGAVDDRHTRHITHDNRLLSALTLRRRLDHLGNNQTSIIFFLINFYLVKKDKRWEGGNITAHDDSVLALISHATEERLKYVIEQIKSIAQQRTNLSIQV